MSTVSNVRSKNENTIVIELCVSDSLLWKIGDMFVTSYWRLKHIGNIVKAINYGIGKKRFSPIIFVAIIFVAIICHHNLSPISIHGFLTFRLAGHI